MPYKRCLFTGGDKCKGLLKKSLGPQFIVHIWEVSAYGRCPQAEVRLYYNVITEHQQMKISPNLHVCISKSYKSTSNNNLQIPNKPASINN